MISPPCFVFVYCANSYTLLDAKGTLYGRCKREGIELSRSNPTPWSEDAMNEALNSVRYVKCFLYIHLYMYFNRSITNQLILFRTALARCPSIRRPYTITCPTVRYTGASSAANTMWPTPAESRCLTLRATPPAALRLLNIVRRIR